MATNITTPSLTTLPIELIYRILEILDSETILFSFRNVCKHFHIIIKTYDQYKLNFQSISKPHFHSICYLIHPENLISLTLSNDNNTPDQIKWFLSFFHLEQFTRLRSLTLIQIDENHFITIFEYENIITSLNSLSFTLRKNCINDSKTLSLISSIISQKNLRNLDFTLSWNKIDVLSWPNQCLLQSLTISNRIDFHQFSNILSHSLRLKKFVLQDCIIENSTDISSLISDGITYPQLISMTFDDSELDMNECELILALVPSLEYFYIIGGTDLSDGYQWEQFIQRKLLKLKQFQFAFCGHTEFKSEDSNNVEVLINSFRTPFWMENKHWFVVCYYFKDSANYSLYSLPICKSNVRFYPHKDKISCSTFTDLNQDVTMTDNVHEIQLNLNNLMSINDENQEITSSTYLFFRKLNKLLLCIDDEWPTGSFEFLSTFINLSCITELSINVEFNPRSVSNKLTNIINLLKQIFNLHSLTIDSSSANAEDICSIVPDHIKHLQVPVKHLDGMKLIIEQLQHLSSVTFEVFNDFKFLLVEFSTWLMEKRNKSTYRVDSMFVSIWFDKINNQTN